MLSGAGGRAAFSARHEQGLRGQQDRINEPRIDHKQVRKQD